MYRRYLRKTIFFNLVLQAAAIEIIAQKLGDSNGEDAARFELAARYIDAFGELAQENNTLILPAETGDVPAMIGTAMKSFQSINKS